MKHGESWSIFGGVAIVGLSIGRVAIGAVPIGVRVSHVDLVVANVAAGGNLIAIAFSGSDDPTAANQRSAKGIGTRLGLNIEGVPAFRLHQAGGGASRVLIGASFDVLTAPQWLIVSVLHDSALGRGELLATIFGEGIRSDGA